MSDFGHVCVETEGKPPSDVVGQALETVRKHLGMDIAYLSEFVGDKLVFRAVESGDGGAPVAEGDDMPVEETYCFHVNAGRLPEMMPDISKVPFAAGMPVTDAAGIGSHVSVPIKRDDGSVFGMFCCLGRAPHPSLNARDLAIMESFASLASDQINDAIRSTERTGKSRRRITEVLNQELFTVALQPIFDLSKSAVVGFEALNRFTPDPYRTPDVWFAEAAEIGLGTDLELAVMRAQIGLLPTLPEPMYLSINASPETVASGRLGEVLSGQALDRVVLEITEHVQVSDYVALTDELAAWRRLGLGLAIDDAGAGYAGFQHILRLAPDILKLDISLTSGIDSCVVRRSLAAALVRHSTESAIRLVAEGIETEAERDTLRRLGVPCGQGWLLGRPAPHATAIDRFGRGGAG